MIIVDDVAALMLRALSDDQRRKLFAWYCPTCGQYLGPETGGACIKCDAEPAPPSTHNGV